MGCVEVAEGVGLVGCGGWGDARHGDLLSSDVVLNDYVHIQELEEVFVHGPDTWELEGQHALVARLRQLGDEAAAVLEPALHTAASLYTQVIVLTHVPPFPEAAFRTVGPWTRPGSTATAAARWARPSNGWPAAAAAPTSPCSVATPTARVASSSATTWWP